ncbi:tRNA (guanosine(37)-N1)-methyltransferase TrmD [Lignipirellula cremea]|uniref:tRNA (guanine-N(1)-)-methyltransferase n=1 Tax=Lignipirellula cremea TaxID=2528010 RepID=A0A518E1K8_9BACT|nr:tRNA (guanosine(37)-N1)-methyltransferase TrmD [Lignipirellula cremea]QDU97951.1 tRNA (guanine-N(1)-)-methyltransferase [Lignipirellula cremea]
MRFDVLTLFPRIFDGYLGESLLHKAIEAGLVQVHTHDIRDWSRDKHRKVDDRPFGGGPGMVLQVEPIVDCVEAVSRQAETAGRLVMLTPQGRRLTQSVVEELAEEPRLILLCGRYEGFDQRVIDLLQPDELSIGDYILNGGETAAMVMIDAVVRLIPGVLGDEQSSVDDSFSHGDRLLEFPHYTRPRVFRGLETPPVLLSGDHQAIARWRREQSYLRTEQRRADLLPDSTESATGTTSDPQTPTLSKDSRDEPRAD